MLHMTRRLCLPLLLSLFLLFQPLMTPAMAQQPSTLDPANMDFSVDPAENFYQFANGGWLDRTEIPPYAGAYGSFSELRDLTRDQLFSVLEMAESNAALEEGSDEWKAVELYRQGMDLETRNAQGVEPIRPLLDEIEALQTLDDVHAFQRTAAFDLLSGLMTVYVDADLLDSTVYVPYLEGPYLGLPSRDYYLDEEPDIRDAYIEMAAELLAYAGYDDARARQAAEAVYGFEHAMAGATLSREEQQDFSLIYNPMTLDELRSAYPLMDWEAYITDLGMADVDTFIVPDRGFLEALPGIIEATPVDAIKA